MTQLLSIDKVMILEHNIDLQYFIMMKSKEKLLKNQKVILEIKGIFKNPIVTEITPFKNFYVAEDYHKNYYDNHQQAPYCNFVIEPKIHKLFMKYEKDIDNLYK